MSSVPIGEHALLSDRHSAALVSSAGSIDWLCMPRFDSPAIFSAILDDEAGHWSIHPDAGSLAAHAGGSHPAAALEPQVTVQ